jgi:pilus assembly protein CpaB
MKNTKALLISLAVALFAVMFVFSYVQRREQTLIDLSTPVKVVVAARDLADGTRLDETNISIREIPKQYVQPGAMSDVTTLFDRVVYVPALEGSQILESMLASPEKAGIAQKIPKDKVGFTVAVNAVTAVSGLVQPGDFVDVLMTVEVGQETVEQGKVEQEIFSKVVLENVLILAVDQRSRRIAIGPGFQTQKSGPGNVFNPESLDAGPAKGVTTVTLAVSHEDCLRLNLAQEIGSISLALRSSWDQGEPWEAKSLESNNFLGVKKPVIRRSLPAWVEIRGAEQVSRF